MTHRGDPLLAWWRTGLGMCGAFTSDAQARWAEPWISNWPGGFSKFWAQVARHLMRKQDAAGVELQVNRRGSRASVVVDAVDSDGAFINQVPTSLTVFEPRHKERKLPMAQTAPGRYEAIFETPVEGEYWMSVVQNAPGKPAMQLTHGLAVDYPDELRLRPVDRTTLEALASATGGRFNPRPDLVLEPSERTVPRDRALWPEVLVAAAILFVADVALRRISFERLSTSVSSLPGSVGRVSTFPHPERALVSARRRADGRDGDHNSGPEGELTMRETLLLFLSAVRSRCQLRAAWRGARGWYDRRIGRLRRHDALASHCASGPCPRWP